MHLPVEHSLLDVIKLLSSRGVKHGAMLLIPAVLLPATDLLSTGVINALLEVEMPAQLSEKLMIQLWPSLSCRSSAHLSSFWASLFDVAVAVEKIDPFCTPLLDVLACYL
jgi:hypothetical protein